MATSTLLKNVYLVHGPADVKAIIDGASYRPTGFKDFEHAVKYNTVRRQHLPVCLLLHCHTGTSDKFWGGFIESSTISGIVQIFWGRRGARAQWGSYLHDRFFSKLLEKRDKGYRLVRPVVEYPFLSGFLSLPHMTPSRVEKILAFDCGVPNAEKNPIMDHISRVYVPPTVDGEEVYTCMGLNHDKVMTVGPEGLRDIVKYKANLGQPLFAQ